MHIHTPVAITLVGITAGNDRGDEAEQQGTTVEEHVERVGNQAKTVCPHTIEQLHKCKAKIHEEKEKDVPRVVALKHGSACTRGEQKM